MTSCSGVQFGIVATVGYICDVFRLHFNEI